MMNKYYIKSSLYNLLMDQIQTIPVIDTHEHMMGLENREKYKEPISALTQGYIQSDLRSAAFGIQEKSLSRLFDPNVTTDEKWPLFQKLWQSSKHTTYAKVTHHILKNYYGEEELTREAISRVGEKIVTMEEADYLQTIDDANIKAMIVDVLGWLPGGLGSFLDGKKVFHEKWRPMISLPGFHPVKMNWTQIQYIGSLVDCHITSLDEYLESIFSIFQRCIERGAIGIKDQSAYERIISYELTTEYEAEKYFNQILSNPRGELGWPEVKPLNDYLFHQFMRFARELKLPVQVHTGHMAGNFNRVGKTNAEHLSGVFELHQEVKFDLFHGNWPYSGDLLFLCKNYPNVFMDLCWVHIIDPSYSIDLLVRSALTFPHKKIHGFGGDYGDFPEYVSAHLQIAKQNIVFALMSLIEKGWVDESEAVQLAKDWLFNNPNEFFNLGFSPI